MKPTKMLLTYIGHFPINEEQEAKIISSDGEVFDLDGNLIFRKQIQGILKPDRYIKYREMKGDYLCQYNKWHTRGDECQCYFEKKDTE